MNITIQRKTLGRSRKLAPVQYELPAKPNTLRELLHMLVVLELDRYDEANTVIQFLTATQQAQLEARGGAVKFTTIMRHGEQSLQKSINIMEQAYEDGLFKVLQAQHVYTSLEEPIHSAASEWTFIKLTFLTGM